MTNAIPAATPADLARATFARSEPNAQKAARTAAGCTQVSTTDDYPWGGQRCTRSIWVELDGLKPVRGGKFKVGRGFRVVTQTVNPKTGRVCAARAGTYHTAGLVVLCTEADTGHVVPKYLDFNGYEMAEASAAWLADHPEVEAALPPAAHRYAWLALQRSLVLNARYTPWGEDVTPEDMNAVLKIAEIADAMNARRPVTDWGGMGFTAAAIRALEKTR